MPLGPFIPDMVTGYNSDNYGLKDLCAVQQRIYDADGNLVLPSMFARQFRKSRPKLVPVYFHYGHRVYMEDLVANSSAKPTATDAIEDPVLPIVVDGLESEDEHKHKAKSSASAAKRSGGVADIGKKTKKPKVSDNKG